MYGLGNVRNDPRMTLCLWSSQGILFHSKHLKLYCCYYFHLGVRLSDFLKMGDCATDTGVSVRCCCGSCEGNTVQQSATNPSHVLQFLVADFKNVNFSRLICLAKMWITVHVYFCVRIQMMML